LEDDFLGQLDKTPTSSDAEGSEGEDSGSEYGSDRGRYLPPKRLRNGFYDTVDEDDHFETKSHFTNYSMTSSILSRTKELQFLDERFDKVMEGYDDEEIGELEDGPE